MPSNAQHCTRALCALNTGDTRQKTTDWYPRTAGGNLPLIRCAECHELELRRVRDGDCIQSLEQREREETIGHKSRIQKSPRERRKQKSEAAARRLADACVPS